MISFSLLSLNTISMLITPKFNSLAQTSPANNTVINPLGHLSLPLGWLSDVSNVMCPKLSSCGPDLDLLSLGLPLLSKQQLHSSCCSGQKRRNHPAPLSPVPHMRFISNPLGSSSKLHSEFHLFFFFFNHLFRVHPCLSPHPLLPGLLKSLPFLPLCYPPPLSQAVRSF